MKQHLLPLIWYVSAALGFLAGFVGGRALGAAGLAAIFSAWLVSLTAAWAVHVVALSIDPELRFDSEVQIDGHGYLHQPMSVVVHVTLLAILLAIVVVVKSLSGMRGG